jgi:hypothetical protein
MKKKERLLWAWKWKGCQAIDPHSIAYTKREIEKVYAPPALVTPPGSIVRVAVREV